MKFATVAMIATAYLGVAQASLGYQFFDQQNLKGASVQGTPSINTCTPMPAGWNDRVRSFIVANGDDAVRTLAFYNDAGCKGRRQAYSLQPTAFFTQDALPAPADKQWSSFRYA